VPAPEVAAAEPVVEPEPPPKELPARRPRVPVFLGSQGFLIGDATYRFDMRAINIGFLRSGKRVVSPRCSFAARARWKPRTHHPDRLAATEFSVERGGPDRREVARFDWEVGIVTLHDQQTAPLDLMTFDPMALMLAILFSPQRQRVEHNVATTRRVYTYTIVREGTETITGPQGAIETSVGIAARRRQPASSGSRRRALRSVKLRIVATSREHHRGTARFDSSICPPRRNDAPREPDRRDSPPRSPTSTFTAPADSLCTSFSTSSGDGPRPRLHCRGRIRLAAAPALTRRTGVDQPSRQTGACGHVREQGYSLRDLEPAISAIDAEWVRAFKSRLGNAPPAVAADLPTGSGIASARTWNGRT
jgi:hypothetical protein